jgi:hypothetical protein
LLIDSVAKYIVTPAKVFDENCGWIQP